MTADMVTNILRYLFLFAVTIYLLFSCSQNEHVKEYFENHGMSYPVDTSGVSLFSVKHVGISDDEMLAQGAGKFVEEGILFTKEHFKHEKVKNLIPGAEALFVSHPVLFRDEAGDVGFMVKVTVFGAGDPGSEFNLPVEWLGSDKKIWKAENFAYFNRNDFYRWQHGGWVY